MTGRARRVEAPQLSVDQEHHPVATVARTPALDAGNQAVTRLLTGTPVRVSRLAAETPAAAPGQTVLPPGESSPVKVGAQLGVDHDDGQLAAAQGRLESLWIKDMFTALQILRVNGSPKARNQTPFRWLIDSRASAAPRTRLALKVIGAPETVADADFAGLPDDQVREVRAFLALRSWDDPVAGLPRKGQPGAGALTDQQRDMIDYIRRRREVATEARGTVSDAAGKGWQYGGTPARDPLPTGAAPGSLDAEIWNELDLEGSASAVNTYDDQIFTWGKGWSAKSTLPAIANAFFAADPGARQELMEAGFTYRAAEGKWLFVSVDSGYVLDGINVMDTPEFRRNKKFVGLLAHLVEDPAHQQNMVDAQWAALRTNTANVPASIRAAWPGTWSTEAVRFAAHCVHWGYSWGQMEPHGPAIADLLRWISDRKGKTDANGAIIIRGWPSQTIRHFAHRAGERLMSGPAPLPSPTVAGTYYFQGDGGSPNYWTWRP